MKSNPILEKKINTSITTNNSGNYVYVNNRELNKDMLSDFYDHIIESGVDCSLPNAKEFLIKTFLDD
jgi:hypothetical protein